MIPELLKNKIDSASEVEHYMFIQECGDYLWTISHGIGKGDIPDSPEIQEGYKEVKEIQEYVVSKLYRFGVDPKSATEGPRESSSYWKWFEHWHNWHKKELTDEQWKIVDEKLQKEQDITEYLPKKRWNE